jgi:hypothetical protein
MENQAILDFAEVAREANKERTAQPNTTLNSADCSNSTDETPVMFDAVKSPDRGELQSTFNL